MPWEQVVDGDVRRALVRRFPYAILCLADAESVAIIAETIGVEFDAELTAVFASELEIDGDPIGGDASGSVSLLGAADQKGKQATLAKGTFYGSFSRDSDGGLALGGYGTDDWATSESSASVLLGEALVLEGSDGPAAVVTPGRKFSACWKMIRA